jgi:hypothetical protein
MPHCRGRRDRNLNQVSKQFEDLIPMKLFGRQRSKRLLLLFFLTTASVLGYCQSPVYWSLVLQRPGQKSSEIARLPENYSKPFHYQITLDDITVNFDIQPRKGYAVFKARAITGITAKKMFFSIQAHYNSEVPYNFNGSVLTPEIFRQSPHDVNAWIVTTIAEQAVPVVALRANSFFQVALSGSPYLYKNFTSQSFYTDKKVIELSSGDNGLSPGLQPDTSTTIQINYNADKTQVFSPGKVLEYYHDVDPSKPHEFEGLLFNSYSNSLNGLRKDINIYIADYFSNGQVADYFGALAFTTAYMNLRSNDSQKSKWWVVPSVEYSNTQYGRDAFWISMMLSPEQEAECLRSELAKVNNYAEYPLFTVLWAYRLYRKGIIIEPEKAQAYVNAIEKRARDNYFYSYTDEDGRLDFQYWGDVMAFEKGDVLAYNQGLYALAILAARNMGLKILGSPETAADNYRQIFNKEHGFLPISRKKQFILGPDPLIPDLLSQLYFDSKLLETDHVRQHYNRLTTYSKTPFGFKILSSPDGTYLSSDQYDVPGYVSQINREKMPDGQYLRGGSFFLYDNLFLIDAYMHKIPGAEENLLWRVGLDFKIGNTTYETINTQTGEPWKPNMGWNVAVYAIWRKLMDEGKADSKLFESINQLSKSH